MAPIGRGNYEWSALIDFYAISSAFSVLIVCSLVLIIWKCACCRQKRRRAYGDHNDHRSGTLSGDSLSKGDDDVPEPIQNQTQAQSVIRGRGRKAPTIMRSVPKHSDEHEKAEEANGQVAHDDMIPTIMRNTGLSPPPSLHPPDQSELQEETQPTKCLKTKRNEKNRKKNVAPPTRYQKKKPVEVRSILVGTQKVNAPSAYPSPIQDPRRLQPVAAPKKTASDSSSPFVVAKTVRNVRREEKGKSQSSRQEKVRSTTMISEEPTVTQVGNVSSDGQPLVKSIEFERIMTERVRIR